ncbi:hypothetical protein K469DRAFT_598765 [Zopfia rhizophila CBS 207.26]|uniref:DUF7770 domain-containing protein n=1 Tax=Zopfia rhizophila CBS 207.26 TaxID=1314779 RepID=A0A6A6DGV1_9PEZI|nr:hypothetical protein K469DRAFT_598765 [Zopfia rhizophila CBS 207.26]
MQLADTNTNYGKLKVTEHNYVELNSALKYWDVNAAQNIQAGWVYQLITSKGRDQYFINENEVRCRWWVYNKLKIMRDLVAQGYANAKVVENVLIPAMEFNYLRGQKPIPLPIRQRRFV